MTELDAILKAVCESPGDDLPRLMYADAIEDTDPAKAEFVRIGVQLARWDCTFKQTPEQPGWKHNCGADENGYWLCQPMRSRERELFDKFKCRWLDERMAVYYLPDEEIVHESLSAAVLARGFLSVLTCSWPDFLRVADALIWTPGQTVECPECKAEPGGDLSAETMAAVRSICEECGATGRVPRPFVPTCQPITRVTLTTMPGTIVRPEETVLRIPANTGVGDGYRFDRVKCPTCTDGTVVRHHGSIYSPPEQEPCPDCHGTPLNEWHCDKWPGVTFEMPTTDGVAAVRRLARATQALAAPAIADWDDADPYARAAAAFLASEAQS